MHALKEDNKGLGKQVPRKLDLVQGGEGVDSRKINSGSELPNLSPPHPPPLFISCVTTDDALGHSFFQFPHLSKQAVRTVLTAQSGPGIV